MKDFQIQAWRALADLAKILHLTPDPLDSGNGTEFKNHLNDTVFTVYHQRLDSANEDRIEVAIGIDNIASEFGLDANATSDWLSRVQSKYPVASPKSPQSWPRVALWSMDEVTNFEHDLRSLFSPANRATAVTITNPLSTNPQARQSIDEKVLRQVLTRRGQAAFRSALLEAYGSTCAISGCTDEPVLEAAHIEPHTETQDYRTENGLLLRADIHTLFDLRLVSIDPQSGNIVVSAQLSPTYQVFGGQRLRIPTNPEKRPNAAALMRHFMAWQAQESQ